MKKSGQQMSLSAQKCIVALCALMAVVPAVQLFRGIRHEDTSLTQKGGIGCVFGVSGLLTSAGAYAVNRRKQND